MRRLPPALSLLLILLTSPSPAWAWGRLGHRVIARLAERHLTDQARREVEALLEPGESLADASNWADEHLRDVEGSGPWHYVNIPLDQERYDDRFSGDTAEKGDIVPKIREFKAILRDRSRPVGERRRAMRFLIHLIEDLHQPLHVGEDHDRGGNDLQVRWYDRGSNLHAVWDYGMLEQAGRGEEGWLADLVAIDTDAARGRAQDGSVEDWATESLLAARHAYHDPATGRRIRPGARLSDDYQRTNLPMAMHRLYQAGARLAWVLNEEFRLP